MKTLEKFADLFEMAIYVILSLSALFCIGYSIYERFTTI